MCACMCVCVYGCVPTQCPRHAFFAIAKFPFLIKNRREKDGERAFAGIEKLLATQEISVGFVAKEAEVQKISIACPESHGL